MKALKYLLLIALVCAAALHGFYLAYWTGYKKHYVQELAWMNERLNGHQPYDVLFLGSSRTFRQINPRIVDSLAGTNSFNAGLDGVKLSEMNVILESYLKNHKATKLVVIDLPAAAFDGTMFPFYNQTLYYPFLDNEIVFNNLKTCRPARLFRTLPFFQLTEANDETRQRAFSGLFGSRYSQAGDYYKGFNFPPADTVRLPFARKQGTASLINEKGINYLRRTVALCRAHKVSLMMIYPPAYRGADMETNPDFYPTANRIAAEGEIVVKDYRGLPLREDHRLYRDQTHLNKSGVAIFSRLMAADVRGELSRMQMTAKR